MVRCMYICTGKQTCKFIILVRYFTELLLCMYKSSSAESSLNYGIRELMWARTAQLLSFKFDPPFAL